MFVGFLEITDASEFVTLVTMSSLSHFKKAGEQSITVESIGGQLSRMERSGASTGWFKSV